MTQRKVRIGVVGTGWWATCTHLPALTARPEVDLVALCDRDPERLRLSAEAFHVGTTYTDFRRMLARERLDGVVVATAQPAHYEVAQSALVAGCHLLCEKPMVLSVSHAQELIELASRQGRAIVMSYPWNYTAHTQRARQAVLAGEVGEIQLVSSLYTSTAYQTYRGNLDAYAGILQAPLFGPLVDTNTQLSRGGGQGYVQVTHAAALIFRITGLRPQQVTAGMNWLDTEVDVVDAINVQLSNGALGVLASTGNLRPGDAGQHNLSVYGSRGYLLLDLVAGTLTVRRQDNTVESPPPLPPEERYPRFAPANNFVDVILGNAENLAPGDEVGRTTVLFVDAAYRSAARGGAPVTVTAYPPRRD